MINLIGAITAFGAWWWLAQSGVFGALAYVCNYVPYISRRWWSALFAAGLVAFPSIAHAAARRSVASRRHHQEPW